MGKLVTIIIFAALTAFCQIPQGEVIEGFENIGEWSFEGSGVYNSLESIHSEGTSAIKLGTNINEKASMTKTISMSFNDFKVFSIDVYTPDFSTSLKRSIRIDVSSSSTFSHHLRINIYAGQRLNTGWTRLYFSKEDFTEGWGVESWSNTMVKIKFTEWIESAGEVVPSLITFDNFIGYRVKPPAIVIISFDDNEKSSLTIGKPVLDALGFKAVQFVIGSTADQNLSNWLNWSDYDSLYQQGWDISNHTYTHPYLTSLDEASMELEINGMRDLLISHGYTRSCDFFAYPYSDYNDNVLNKVKVHHKMGRGAADWAYNAHPSSVLGDYYLIRVQSEWDDLQTQQQDINKAIERGQLLVYMFHNISGYADRFTSTMQYLKTKQDAGEIQVMTFSQYWDYLHSIVPGVTIKTKVMLQGPYNAGTGNMNTSLAVPTTSPYSDHHSVAAIPPGIVDWVQIELRSTSAGSAVISRSAFLKNDGSIKDDDGSSDLSFEITPGYYYIVVKHRNHLDIMSSVPVDLSSASTLFDFTTAQNQAFTSGQNPMINLASGKYGMIAGDTDDNETIDHSIDIMAQWYPNLGLSGYYNADYNMDGTVEFSNDIALWLPNFGMISQVPNASLGKSVKDTETQELSDKYDFQNYNRKFDPEKDGNGCQDYFDQKINEKGTVNSTGTIENSIPKEFSISQNYPNPFNPTTSIRYNLKEDAMVIMNLYNSIGEKVYTVLDQEQSAGIYTQNIDGSRLANGTYLLNVTLAGATETKNETLKLMLLK